MDRKTIEAYLERRLTNNNTPCLDAFCNVMEDRNYGREETLDAWNSFREGWNACIAKLTHRLQNVWFEDNLP